MQTVKQGYSGGTIEVFSTTSMMKNPRIQITLGPLILRDLEAYASSIGNTTANEAGRIVTDKVLMLRDEGKIPSDQSDAESNGSLMETYLKMLVRGTEIPNEIIKLVANETGLTEEELRKLRDRLLP